MVIKDGNAGLYHAVVTAGGTLPDMTVFRPDDMTPFGNEESLYRIEKRCADVFLDTGKTAFFR